MTKENTNLTTITIKTMYTLKPEYQAQVDLVQARPFVLRRVWNWDSEKDTWDEAEIARSKTKAGIKAYVRLHKIPSRTGEYRIEQDSVEFTDGWFPHFDSELIEEL